MQGEPRRILTFSLFYYPHPIGGAEVAVKEITDRIGPGEFEFDMITLRKDKSLPEFERAGNINVHRVGGKSKVLYILNAARKASSLINERSYDAFWPIMASYAGFAVLLLKKMNRRARQVPVLLTIQEGDNFARREGALKPAFSAIFKSADRIQAISNYLSDWAKKMGATCPIDVVPNGVSFEHFSGEGKAAAGGVGGVKEDDGEAERAGVAGEVAEREREILRSKSGFKNKDIILITASRLVHKNAVDDIISSLKHLNPAYKLWVLGTGEDEAKLKALAKQLEVTARVVFEGFVSHSELPKYLRASDIFVRPSRTEGLGNSFIEAMAAGIPVIATAVGGIPDFLVDGETGLFAEVDNPRSIAQKAEKLSKDVESREYIVKRAREMVKNKYGWDGVTERMKDCFYLVFR